MNARDKRQAELAIFFCTRKHGKRWQPTPRRRAMRYPCRQCVQYAFSAMVWFEAQAAFEQQWAEARAAVKRDQDDAKGTNDG